jgi:hypothetical protein
MAGVLARIIWPQKRPVVGHSSSAPRVDRRILELLVAKEILSEIFDVGISDVEEMIQNRYAELNYETDYGETELWPQEFMLGE